MTDTAPYTEEELVILLQQKNSEGFSYLYKTYSEVLYGIIHKIIADEAAAQEVLQEVFVKIWHELPSYEAAKGRIHSWMMHIARDAAIARLRSKNEIFRRQIRSDESSPDVLEQGLKTMLQVDSIGLNKLVAALGPQHQQVINLSYYRGYTVAEIAEHLQTPADEVKSLMREAIYALQQNPET